MGIYYIVTMLYKPQPKGEVFDMNWIYAYITNILNKLKHTEKTQVLSISG